jgi:hypothetical protein
MDLPGLNRRRFLATSLTAASAAMVGFRVNAAEATVLSFDPSTDIIKAPKDPQLWPQFRAKLTAWRAQQRSALNYSDALYRRKDFEWVAGSYACCFLMLCDERFYDATNGRYRVKEWLEASQRDLGGFDSAVLWHAYGRRAAGSFLRCEVSPHLARTRPLRHGWFPVRGGIGNVKQRKPCR